MAMRYSGKGRVRIVWDDASSQWRARVNDGTTAVTVWVGRPPAERLAVDCPDAYDSAARAAIAFACDAGGSDVPCETPVLDSSAFETGDDMGYVVHRRPWSPSEAHRDGR